MTSTVEPPWTFPLEWRRCMGELAGRRCVAVAGFEIDVEITKPQLKAVYLPLLGMLDRRAQERDQRLLGGLAGIPGAGKSCFAAALIHLATRLLPAGRLVVVGMDGWHWPNAELDARTTTDASGRPIPLRKRKGGPESFDVSGLAAALDELLSPEREILLPAYDRQRHDPVPGAVRVEPHTRIILVEGNYLLCNEPPWNTVSGLLGPKLFLECDPATGRQRILDRHVRGGLTPEEAAEKFEVNDRPNTAAVLASAAGADFHIALQPAPAIRKPA